MRVYRLIASLVILIGLQISSIETVQADQNDVRIVVKYKKNEKNSTNQLSNQEASNLTIVSVPESRVDSTLKQLNYSTRVDFAEIDQLVYTQNNYPNDSLYFQQKKDYHIMNVLEAWENYELKKEVIVAVVDSGVDLTHPDLQGRLIDGKNFIDESEEPMDYYGHGTHVTGLVGAITNNEEGIASIAKNVKIMPIKVFDGKTTYMSTVIEGIRYSADNGADIINLSLGSYSNMRSLQEAIDYAVNKGSLVVGAVGNDSEQGVLYPANYANVLGVGSIDSTTVQKSTFSNFGLGVDVSAPGTDIYSTWINGYQSLGGTSMSTAIVSSMAAMLKQNSPFLTGLQLKEIIENSTKPLPAVKLLGEGLVNAESALQYIEEKNRLFGATSIETAAQIARNGWSELKNKEIVVNGENKNGTFLILASGDVFADSLAVSPLASFLDSPILLVKNGKLAPSVISEVERLNPTYVLVVGGESAIPQIVESEINGLGVETSRISGKDRYETAVAINRVIPYSTNKAFIVSGENYPDALSVASYSGSKQYPILFVKKGEIPDIVEAYIKDNNITKTYVIGGNNVISASLTKNLPAAFRIFGMDRYETNYQVHQTFSNNDRQTLYFATGRNFPDALTISSVASRSNSPVILVDPYSGKTTSDSVRLFNPTESYRILGGPGAISIEKAWEIDEFMRLVGQ
ncbi:S8 family serine peptidase [Bacillus sp. 2205SS5-2]|uniref:S8 family serine peptidase n=1 Tax=Bacillus sp. 2205SS5-2 TaxID=3109031 RepID=UPI0030057339